MTTTSLILLATSICDRWKSEFQEEERRIEKFLYEKRRKAIALIIKELSTIENHQSKESLEATSAFSSMLSAMQVEDAHEFLQRNCSEVRDENFCLRWLSSFLTEEAVENILFLVIQMRAER